MEDDRRYGRLIPAPLSAYKQSLAAAAGTLAGLSHALDTVRRTCGGLSAGAPQVFPWNLSWGIGMSDPRPDHRTRAAQRMLRARLRELIAALDRRAPRLESEAHRRIADQAADLKREAQTRIAELESRMLTDDLIDVPTEGDRA